MDLGTRLEGLLQEFGLSQTQAAEELHIAKSTMNGYIKGRRQPSQEMLKIMADYFHVSPDYLVGNTNIRKYPEGELTVREGNLVGIYRDLQTDNHNILMKQAEALRVLEMNQKNNRKK